jgi:hypothetical protein
LLFKEKLNDDAFKAEVVSWHFKVLKYAAIVYCIFAQTF